MKLITREQARLASLRRWAILDQSVALQKRQRGFIIDPYRYGGGGGGPTDPNYANVKSLLHFEGADASTTFTDAFRTWTAVGNAQIDTAQFKFGASSGLFDGTGDCITSPHDSALDVSGDHTIEGFCRPANIANFMYFYSNGDYNTAQLSVRMTDIGRLQAHTGNGSLYIQTTSSGFTANTWSHWVWEQSTTDNAKYLFIDGVLLSSNAGTIAGTGTGSARIGAVWSAGVALPMNGHLDEIRITPGIARYPAAGFTVPAAAFPDS
jgi:hypothetical protein